MSVNLDDIKTGDILNINARAFVDSEDGLILAEGIPIRYRSGAVNENVDVLSCVSPQPPEPTGRGAVVLIDGKAYMHRDYEVSRWNWMNAQEDVFAWDEIAREGKEIKILHEGAS